MSDHFNYAMPAKYEGERVKGSGAGALPLAQ